MIFKEADIDRFHTSYILELGICNNWLMGKDKQNYGIFYANGKSYKAHRVCYFLNYGDIPKDLCVCHTCDNPSCVNPEHLFLGTVQDNNSDRHRKGRSRNKPKKGSEHSMAKLSWKDVTEIRTTTGLLQKELAEKYQVSNAQISRIINGSSW